MPKWWFDNSQNRIKEGDTSEEIDQKIFNQHIVADKKPYFFIYNYPTLYREYHKYLKTSDQTCRRTFSMSLAELLEKEDYTLEEEEFLDFYYRQMPVNAETCIVNEICWIVEEEFDGIKDSMTEFDPTLLKSPDARYSEEEYFQIEQIYKEYTYRTQQYSASLRDRYVDKEEKQAQRQVFIDQFVCSCFSVVNNEDVLCNIMIDLCYSNSNSKQFVWDICGGVIIKNLLKRHDYTMSVPVADETGDILFGGERYSMKEVKVDKEGEDL